MKTLVIGASENRERYSNMAIRELRKHGHEVIAVGTKKGKVEDVLIETEIPQEKVHTISLYLNSERQQPYFKQLLGLHPERIIFNPGTENKAFEQIAKDAGAEVLEACTLVMLRTNQY